MKILYITSSIMQENSVSNELAKAILSHVVSKNSTATVIHKDLGANPPAHLSLPVISAVQTRDVTGLTDAQKAEYDAILQSIQELKEADLVIIGSGMYNLGVSGNLKAWIDQVCQAGLTFSYTESGLQGLIEDKPVIVASTRGGFYSVAPNNVFDHQEPYLRDVLHLIGIKDVTFIRAEGVNVSPEIKQEAMMKAMAEIAKL